MWKNIPLSIFGRKQTEGLSSHSFDPSDLYCYRGESENVLDNIDRAMANFTSHYETISYGLIWLCLVNSFVSNTSRWLTEKC